MTIWVVHILLFQKPVMVTGISIQQYMTGYQMSRHLSERSLGIEEGDFTERLALQNTFPAPNRFNNQLVLDVYDATR